MEKTVPAEVPRPAHGSRDTAPTPHSALRTPHFSLLVAHADRVLAALEGQSDSGKRLRDQARAIVRGATLESAAGFLAAAALERSGEARDGAAARDLVAATEAAARIVLESAGAAPDASPTQGEDALRRELVPDAAPAGTVLAVLAPSWRDAAGKLVAPGSALASAGPRRPLAAALERALRAARRLAKRAEDLTAQAAALEAGLADLDREREIERATSAVRLVEGLAAVHGHSGRDAAEAGVADLVLLLETWGVTRVPREADVVELAGTDDTFETDHLVVQVADDPSPPGTVTRRTRSAFVRAGKLVGELKGEVTVSRGVASPALRAAEKRLEELARGQEGPRSGKLSRAGKSSAKLAGARPAGACSSTSAASSRAKSHRPTKPRLARRA